MISHGTIQVHRIISRVSASFEHFPLKSPGYASRRNWKDSSSFPVQSTFAFGAFLFFFCEFFFGGMRHGDVQSETLVLFCWGEMQKLHVHYIIYAQFKSI